MKLYNKNLDKDIPKAAVYIGRGSIWGNPFVIGKDGTRSHVVAQYRDYLLRNPFLLVRLPELTGKDLVCFCTPKKCHGDILMQLANGIDIWLE